MTPDHFPFLVTERYPPQKHILRDLKLSLTFQRPDRATLQAPVVTQICSDSGDIHVGVLATMADVLGGLLSMESFFPDWMATANLSLHASGRLASKAVAARGRLLRSGRTTATVSVEIYTEDPAVVIGASMITYARIEGNRVHAKPKRLKERRIEFEWPGDASGMERHVVEQTGLRLQPEKPGCATLEMSDYVRNSFGSLQGGMIALLADMAGQSAAGAATGRRMSTTDLVMHYLSPGRFGPFTTTTDVLRTDRVSVLTRIEVKDRGDDQRIIAVAMNTSA